MEEDKDLKEAAEACTKIIEEKCGKRPYMLIISKANVKFASEEHKKKGIVTGNASYIYFTKPPLKKNGISKLLVDTSRHALNTAEKKILEDSTGAP